MFMRLGNGAAVGWNRFDAFPGKLQTILNSVQRINGSIGVFSPVSASIRQNDEMTCHIPAVDSGDISRFERSQVGSGVPVEEMALQPLHFLQGGKSCLQTVGGFVQARP